MTRTGLAAYGLLGMPLAMAALPLYVHLPKFYGEHLGMPLGTLGAVLLVLRLGDGIIDPLLGASSDRAASRKRLIALAVPGLALGMIALFAPPGFARTHLVAWLAGSLFIVYASFSLATINHGAWGAELSADPVERTRITSTREAFALVGVVIASVAPGWLGGQEGDAAGAARFAYVFAVACVACAALTLAAAPARAVAPAPAATLASELWAPLSDGVFARLLGAFMCNGIASAVPATLVLFFIADVLRAPGREGLFLALYFVAGAAGMPLWVALSARVGKVRSWRYAMWLAIAAFVWAGALGEGDTRAFAAICVASGLALGADLALPPSLLADVIGRSGTMHSTGAYFGLWTLATKVNLALAAGIALPLLALAGYAPGASDADALRALSWVYAGVPCALKAGALVALGRFERGYVA